MKFNKNEYLGCSSKNYDLDLLRKHCTEGITTITQKSIDEIKSFKERAKILGYEPEVLTKKLNTYEKILEIYSTREIIQ